MFETLKLIIHNPRIYDPRLQNNPFEIAKVVLELVEEYNINIRIFAFQIITYLIYKLISFAYYMMVDIIVMPFDTFFDILHLGYGMHISYKRRCYEIVTAIAAFIVYYYIQRVFMWE